MRRFLIYWLVLGFVTLLAAGAVSALVFHQIDLSFPVFLQLLVLPAFQAAVLLWVRRQWSFAEIGSRLIESLRATPVAVLLGLDAGVILLGWVLPTTRLVGFGAPGSWQPLLMGAKTLVAAALFGVLAARPARPLDRCWFGLAALGLTAFAVEPFRPWLHSLPGLITRNIPLLLKWLATWGSLFVAVMLAIALTGLRLWRRHALAGFWLDVTLILGSLVAVIVALNIFLYPRVGEPWLRVVRTLLSLAATSAVVAPLWALRGSPEH